MLQIKLKEIRSQKIRPSKIWINYFLRMVELYSKKVCEISKGAQADDLEGSISYLNEKEKIKPALAGKSPNIADALNISLDKLFDREITKRADVCETVSRYVNCGDESAGTSADFCLFDTCKIGKMVYNNT